jgi:preprotein translocase subunit SecD
MKTAIIGVLSLLVTCASAFCSTEVRLSPAFSSDIPNTTKINDTYGDPMYVSTTPLITNKDIQSASMFIDEQGPGISITLKPESAKRVDEALKSLYQQRLAIFVNEKLVSAPTLQTTHFGGRVQITSHFSKAEATKIASDLNGK